MSHSAENCKRGDPLGFINIYSVAKYQKTRKGDSKGKRQRSLNYAIEWFEKVERGNLLSESMYERKFLFYYPV